MQPTEVELAVLGRVLPDLGLDPGTVRVTRLPDAVLRLTGAVDMFVAYAPSETPDEMDGTFAEQIQEHLLESGLVVPACPGHRHPMIVDTDVYPPRWTCPASTRSYAIGGVPDPPCWTHDG